jgi:hypothetical protein
LSLRKSRPSPILMPPYLGTKVIPVWWCDIVCMMMWHSMYVDVT